MPKLVVIENPVFGGARFTSTKSAERYVAKGRARLSPCGRKLRFIEIDYRNISAAQHELDTNRGYDARGLLRVQEIRHIPCAQPEKALHVTARPRVVVLQKKKNQNRRLPLKQAA